MGRLHGTGHARRRGIAHSAREHSRAHREEEKVRRKAQSDSGKPSQKILNVEIGLAAPQTGPLSS